MNFNEYCEKYFQNDEDKALWQLAYEGYHKTYQPAGNKKEFKELLDTLSKSQSSKYMTFFRDILKADNPTEISSTMKPAVALVFSAFFLIVAVYMFVTGCINITKQNRLEANGVPVTITVTDKKYVDAGENSYNEYSFVYEYDGQEYVFTDSPDQEYDIGESFHMYIDPKQPDILVFSSSNIFFAFFMLAFAFGSPFLSERFRPYAKYLPAAAASAEAVMVVTGIILPYSPLTVLGIVFLVLTLALVTVVKLRKRAKARS